MYKVAVLGDRDSIYGFAAIGIETFPVENAAEASKQLKDLADGQYAVIYITESRRIFRGGRKHPPRRTRSIVSSAFFAISTHK